MAINKRLINPGFEAPTPPVPTSFNTVTYTGAQGTGNRSITGVGFKPDFVWIKERTSTSSHSLADIVRGTGLILQSDLTNAEINVVANLVSFDSNGFTIGNSNGVNETGQDYVAWCWKAGGAAVTNTDGTITSQVSANTEAGFSIVSYTGNGVQGATIGNGLNSDNAFIIVKNRSVSVNWGVWHKGLSPNGYLTLNTTNAEGIASSVFPVQNEIGKFAVGTDGGVNVNNQQYIAYCFAEVAGFSKFGSHTTNAKITTGFEPAWVMIKYTGTTSDWWIMDLARWDGVSYGSNGGKLIKPYLEANTSDAEGSVPTGSIEVVSDGFYPTNFFNPLGAIHMAFANQF